MISHDALFQTVERDVVLLARKGHFGLAILGVARHAVLHRLGVAGKRIHARLSKSGQSLSPFSRGFLYVGFDIGGFALHRSNCNIYGGFIAPLLFAQ